jgi:hypothetical protein
MLRLFRLLLVLAVFVAFAGCKEQKTITPNKIPDPPKNKPSAAPKDGNTAAPVKP